MIPSVEVRKQNFQLLFSETGRCGGTLTLEEIRKASVVLIGSNNPASAGFAVVPRPSRGLASIPFVFHLQPAAAKLKNSKVSDVSGSAITAFYVVDITVTRYRLRGPAPPIISRSRRESPRSLRAHRIPRAARPKHGRFVLILRSGVGEGWR